MLEFHAREEYFQLKQAARTSRGELPGRAIWLLEVRDREQSAAVGRGEAGPVPRLSPDAGEDFPARVAGVLKRLNGAGLQLETGCEPLEMVTRLLRPYQAELAELPALVFALETALLDLAHGGRGIVFPSAWTEGRTLLPTHGLIWMDSAQGLVAQVRAKVAAGFDVIKMKIGALPLEEELAVLRTVRGEFPHVTIRLDANGAFTSPQLPPLFAQLAPLGIELLEQPLHASAREEIARLRDLDHLPLALDESLIGCTTRAEREDIVEQLRPEHLILKPALLGGFVAGAEWIEVAQKWGVQWWANSLLETAIGHSAICQWAAAVGGGRVHGLGTGGLFSDNLPSPIRLEGPALRWVGFAEERR